MPEGNALNSLKLEDSFVLLSLGSLGAKLITKRDMKLGWGFCVFLIDIATHSSILAWKIPWTEEPGGLQSIGHKELDMTEHAHTVYLVAKKIS